MNVSLTSNDDAVGRCRQVPARCLVVEALVVIELRSPKPAVAFLDSASLGRVIARRTPRRLDRLDRDRLGEGLTGRVEDAPACASGCALGTYSPTATGAMTSFEHCSTNVGRAREPRSARLSDRNVRGRTAGRSPGRFGRSCRSAPSPSSGRSALPMIAGAIALDHPR